MRGWGFQEATSSSGSSSAFVVLSKHTWRRRRRSGGPPPPQQQQDESDCSISGSSSGSGSSSSFETTQEEDEDDAAAAAAAAAAEGVRVEGVYVSEEAAYAQALRMIVEDGAACLDEEGINSLARVGCDVAAMNLPPKDCWEAVHELLCREKQRIDWDVWPTCWVQRATLLSSARRDPNNSATRILESLGYLFSDEIAPDEEDDEQQQQQIQQFVLCPDDQCC